MSDDEAVVAALKRAGIAVVNIYDLLRDGTPPAAIPVLLALLPTVESLRVKETIVRAVTTEHARGLAAPPLLGEFARLVEREPSPELEILLWAIANALSETAAVEDA